jgi:zinc protease
MSSNESLDSARALVERLNRGASDRSRISALPWVGFGPRLEVERYRLGNGLDVLLLVDHKAPTVAFHTWYRVGSRNEQPGKTGIAHLFEHLMFNETEHLAAGELDRQLEELGAENNASTWMDWTHYNIAVPSQSWPRVAELEAERMQRLVLRHPLVESEKEVVANERRYRVDDDVEGALSERLWAKAFDRHPYRWPTIGWMEDILGFTVADCEQFYRTYYAPNNASLVIVGDVDREAVLSKLQETYGVCPASEMPAREIVPEPEQTEERREEMENLTPTWKLNLGYRSPGIGHPDHLTLSMLSEVLFGGRSARLVKLMVRDREMASDVRGFVSPFVDPGLFEVFANARLGFSADDLLDVVDAELSRVCSESVEPDEIARARARIELSLLQGLTTHEGKASTIGFYEVVLGRPSAAFEQLDRLGEIDGEALLAVARKYLRREQRTVVTVRPQASRAAQAVEQ